MAPRQLSLFDEPSFYESADVELKSAKGGVPSSLWETYSAFANTNGGTIVLGAAEKGDRLDLHGIEDTNKVIDAIWSVLNNRAKVSSNILLADDVTVMRVSDKNFIRIRVPRATRFQRPIFLNNDPFGHTYRRDHTGDYRCPPDQVRRMFADQSTESADSRILPHFSLDDLHLPSLNQYRNRFSASNPNHPWLLEDDLGLLKKLGGWRKDRSSNEEGITVAGLLMFGLEEAIKDPSAVPRYQVDYRERMSDTPDQRWSDRITLDGTWEGNLFQFYYRVLPRIVSSLKAPFQIDASLYRFDESSVGIAVREALVNSLIHADYSGQGGIVIDRYPDRVQFSNPGTLLISHEQLLKGGISECRNKCLQGMFQQMGAGDKAGSGMDRIRTSWEDARFRPPSIAETQNPDRVNLSLPMISLLDGQSIERLIAIFGDRVRSQHPQDVQILVMALEEGSITNARLQEVLTVHRTELTKTLQTLVKANFLKRAGTGRWTSYVLKSPSPHSRAEASHPEADVPTSVPSSVPTSVPTSVPASNLPHSNRFSAFSDDNSWETLTKIGAVAKGNASPELVREVIVELCARAGWLTRAELGSLLGRNSSGIQKRYLGNLVNSRILKLRYSKINHPQQAYGLASAQRTDDEPAS